MAADTEIRLRIVEAVVPSAAKHTLTTKAVVTVCTALENYVLQSDKVPGEPPAQVARPRRSRPPKGDNQD